VNWCYLLGDGGETSEAGIEARLGPQNRDNREDEVETALDLE